MSKSSQQFDEQRVFGTLKAKNYFDPVTRRRKSISVDDLLSVLEQRYFLNNQLVSFFQIFFKIHLGLTLLWIKLQILKNMASKIFMFQLKQGKLYENIVRRIKNNRNNCHWLNRTVWTVKCHRGNNFMEFCHGLQATNRHVPTFQLVQMLPTNTTISHRQLLFILFDLMYQREEHRKLSNRPI